MIQADDHAKLNAVYSHLQMRRRYEVWFVRCGLADGRGAWWFRYLLVQQPKSAGASATAKYFQVWATWFPKNAKPQTFIVDFPLEQLQLTSRGQLPFHCRVPESGIDEGRCWGDLNSQSHRITWDLHIASHFSATLSDKGWIGFSRSPHSDAAFSGEITFDGVKFSGEPLGFGVQGHNCGYRHRTCWRWMHAYFPQPGGASTLEALIYDLPLGLTFRNAVLCHGGKTQRIGQIAETEIVRSSAELLWKFSGKLRDGSSLEALIEGLAPGVHELPYAKTDGSGIFPVSNASLARAVVRLGTDEILETEAGGVLEMGGV
jgi:hypothetical protein